MHVRSANPRFVAMFSVAEHDARRRRALSDFAQMDAGYEQLRTVAAASADSAMSPVEVALQPKSPGTAIAIKARPFPAYDSPSSRVVLLLADGAAKNG
jgi:hypothetical protein